MIDLSPYQLEVIQEILNQHVSDCEVRVFGSRVTWTAKDYSDLDLAIVGKKRLADKILYALKEDFEKSDLPFRVDLLDWNNISDEFRSIINKGYEVLQKKGNKFRQTETPACRADSSAGRGKIPEDWEEKIIGEEQKAIAKILSDLDEKIELNQQMNKTLESIGQALFKSKFEKTLIALYESIDRNLSENGILFQIRDFLRPRLMSGRIRVHVKYG